MNTTNSFFDLLRYSIGISESFPQLTEEEWQDMYETAKKQSLIGIAFMGISKLPAEKQPPKRVKLKWFALAEKIARRNEDVNKVAVAVASKFAQAGYRNCILKGVGNALMYPQPLARTSGDIDLWVEGDIDKLVELARKRIPTAKAIYHHVDFGKVGGVEVELHYRPSFMNNMVYNARMQKWFTAMSHEQMAHRVALPNEVGEISIPTLAFNRIYQMAHISFHVIHEGIGLRQLLDYYYLLQQDFTEEGRQKEAFLLRRFGLCKVASAVMYVLQVIFGLKPEQMLAPVDEKRGRFLLNEIMIAGNFGQYDERVQHNAGALGKNMQRVKRDLRLLRYFPSECLWEPVFRWWHFFWRVAHR